MASRSALLCVVCRSLAKRLKPILTLGVGRAEILQDESGFKQVKMELKLFMCRFFSGSTIERSITELWESDTRRSHSDLVSNWDDRLERILDDDAEVAGAT